MKEKIKLFSKKYLIGFALGLISGSLVMVYAQTYFPSNQTTYDNSTSGMQATDVQEQSTNFIMFVKKIIIVTKSNEI